MCDISRENIVVIKNHIDNILNLKEIPREIYIFMWSYGNQYEIILIKYMSIENEKKIYSINENRLLSLLSRRPGTDILEIKRKAREANGNREAGVCSNEESDGEKKETYERE